MTEIKKPGPKGQRLVTIQRSETERITLTWTSYEGHPYLNVSQWAMDDNGDFKPLGEKVLSVRIRELPLFTEGIRLANELANEERERWRGDTE